MKELTKAEEQVMKYLWKLEKAFLKDVVECFPEPRPAYTTVSTVIRVLVKKDFIGFNTYGKIREYYPLVGKAEYFRGQVKTMVKNFFNNSPAHFAHFFTEDESLDLSELEELKSIIDQRIENKLKEND